MLQQPNIVFVFPDQLSARWVENAQVLTPHLDQFATESVVFTQAYSSSPVCTPYRACLLTGRYPSQTGVTDNGMALPEDARTVAHYLNDAGYATYYIGKWHLSGHPQRNRWVPPEKRGGFQHFIGWESHHVDHWHGLIWGNDPDALQTMRGHETDGLTDIVVEQLTQGLQQPFCLFVSYQAPHPPCSPPAAYHEMYTGQDLEVEPNADPSAYYYRPEWQADYGFQEFRERYFGEITHVDAAFGRVLQTLEDTGLTSNTVVVFTSDHGEMNGAHGLYGKGVMYDEAMRVPLFVRLPSQESARICQTPVSTVDFLPTLLMVAGVALPSDVEGVSLLPLLHGDAVADQPVFSEYGEFCCVLSDGWKLIADHQTLRPLELYQVLDDPFELSNALADQPEVVECLIRLLVDWRTRVSD
jgi:arylsulfatase A-like enzyme